MVMKNTTYDILKKIALIAVPLATFIATVGDIWGLPTMSAVAATVSAFGVFLGACLMKSSADYIPEEDEDGDEAIEDEEEEPETTEEIREDIEVRDDE